MKFLKDFLWGGAEILKENPVDFVTFSVSLVRPFFLR